MKTLHGITAVMNGASIDLCFQANNKQGVSYTINSIKDVDADGKIDAVNLSVINGSNLTLVTYDAKASADQLQLQVSGQSGFRNFNGSMDAFKKRLEGNHSEYETPFKTEDYETIENVLSDAQNFFDEAMRVINQTVSDKYEAVSKAMMKGALTCGIGDYQKGYSMVSKEFMVYPEANQADGFFYSKGYDSNGVRGGIPKPTITIQRMYEQNPVNILVNPPADKPEKATPMQLQAWELARLAEEEVSKDELCKSLNSTMKARSFEVNENDW